MMDEDLEQYDLEVELTLLTPEEGGRDTGVWSGYVTHHFCLDNISWIARLDLQEKKRALLYSGETARVFVTFFFKPHYLTGRLQPGKPFLLQDGVRTIGKGRILSLLNFEQHAEQAKQEEQRQLIEPRIEEKEAPLKGKDRIAHAYARPYTHKKKQHRIT